MYDSKRPDGQVAEETTTQPDRVVQWLTSRLEVEQALQAPLGGVPRERDDRIARMADVLQATAQGLGLPAAAVWAGIPEHVLANWLANDADFSAAVESATALASAHGLRQGKSRTPAAIRVLLVALISGTAWHTAAELAGFTAHQFRLLKRDSPELVALANSARRARPHRPTHFVPNSRRPRRPGETKTTTSFRLVRRADQ
ncbi:hypothetical protein ACGFZS_44015 [Streptomyces sp. NPDC048288]|uniref:hypothetical protein n=1 Tax=Streptomyces sp. NPDC048288 TaxID=3365529 RepID=UPI003718A1A2